MLPALALAATSAWAQQQDNQASGIDKANMDLSVKPGTDFYQYATGGWTAAHPLTPEFSRYAQFDALAENNRKQLRELIEGMAAQQHERGTLEQKIGSLYRLAMDSVRRNKDDFAPIKPLLDEIQALNSRKAIQYEMAKLQNLGVSNFFSFGCDADIKDAKWNLMQVNQGGISMGERDYYLENDEPTKKIRDAYRTYVQNLFTMTGMTAEQATKAMEAVLKIETQIATASYSATKQRDVEGNYHKMSYQQLLTDFPGIDWSTHFLLSGIPAFKEISVNQPEPIHEVEKILADCTIDELKSYLYFKVVDDASSSLSDRFRQEAFNFYNQYYGRC